MARELKVYGIYLVMRVDGASSNQPRFIVAATSKAEALRILQRFSPRLTMQQFNQMGGQTWNGAEVDAATSDPGAVFVALGFNGHGDYLPFAGR